VYEKAHDLLALSRRLRSASQVEQATQAANASVPDFSNLAKLLPERYTEDLGWALNQLATCQRDRGFREEALTTSAKSLCQMHFSARKFPSKANVSVANALRNASWLRARDGDRKKSLLFAERAARICLYALSQRNSTRNNVELARAQTDLSHRRRVMGDIEGASAAMCDAVDLWRNLARGSPVHKLDLAGVLEALSTISVAVDKTGAINSRREAISIYREIKDLAPVAFEPRIADNLNELSNYLLDSNEAAEANLEAITIFQKHAPDNHFSALKLAGALERRAAILKAKGIISAYVGVLENTVSARQKLMEDLVDGAVTPLINALEELAIAYRQTGRRRDALKAIEHAEHLADVHIYEISKAQVARIEAFKQSEISAGEAVRRRISTLWLSSWRRLRA
jgi:tetratricopeptide (TPR) repeat protein